MDERAVEPSGPLRGEARAPASKSAANRALVCAAMARGRSRLIGAGSSDDVARMAANLRQAGVPVSAAGADLEVEGLGGPPRGFGGTFDAGDAGTVLRFLLPFLAAGEGDAVLDGSARMRSRPIGPLVDALVELGGSVEAPGGFPPVRLHARGLRGGAVRLDGGVSSQFGSALLLAAPAFGDGLRLRIGGTPVSFPYLEWTRQVLRDFGVAAERTGEAELAVPPTIPNATTFTVDGDASGAAFLLVGAAITGGRVRVHGIRRPRLQPDARIVELLTDAGCETAVGEGWIEAGGIPRRGLSADLRDAPDLLPPLAVLLAFAPGPSEIRGVGHARRKESDRVAALAATLATAGAGVEELGDGLRIVGRPGGIRGGVLDPRGDHRLAMAFALLGLRVPGVRLRDAACVSKSYPGFFAQIDALRT